MNNQDKLKISKRMITVMLCVLLGCYIAFLLGGKWFATDLPKTFNSADLYIKTHKWLMFLLTFVLLLPRVWLICLSVCQRWKFDKVKNIIIILIVLAISAVRIFIPQNTLQIINLFSITTDFVLFILLPFLIGKLYCKNNLENLLLLVICGYVFYIGYIEIAFTIKELVPYVFMSSMLTGVIYSLDLFIVLTIAYIYSNYIKERRYEMGKEYPIGAGDSDAKQQTKINRLNKKISKMETKLAILKQRKEAM